MFRHLGKQRSLTFNSLKAAQKWKALFDAFGYEEAMSKLDPNDGKRLTLLTHCQSYISHLTGVTNGTKSTYNRYLKNHFTEIGQVEITKITANTVSAWLNDLADKGLAGKSIANIHAFLSGALEVAARDEIILKNPSKGLRLPKTHSTKSEMIFLSSEEFEFLLAEIDPFYQLFILTLVSTGIRFSEATAITVRDVNYEDNSIRINKAWKMTGSGVRELGVPKTAQSNRTVAVPPRVIEAIRKSVEGRKFADLVFTNKKGTQLAHNIFHPEWLRAAKIFEQTYQKRPRIHDCRHSFASACIREGKPMFFISKQLGHASITVTVDRYSHLERTDLNSLAVTMGEYIPKFLPTRAELN